MMKKILAISTLVLMTVVLLNPLVLFVPYKITHPPEGKEGAIIQIVNKQGHNCTAFVISDTKAVTAAHCIDITLNYIDTKHKERVDMVNKALQSLNNRIEILKDCKTPRCQAAYLRMSRSRDLLLPKVAKLRNLKASTYKVFSMYGKDVCITATAFFKNERYRDHAIIKGNFKNFTKIPLRAGFFVESGDKLRACGFAGGNKPPICTDFIALGPESFMYAGLGYFVRGMSGGPVIDKYGFAVGIISAMHVDYALIDTTIGIFDFDFERPKKK